MYQEITLIGNLGNDPELRHTASGTPVASFNLATNEKWTGADGVAHDETTWFRVTVWQKQAEIICQYLHKGSKVFVKGKMKESKPYQNSQSGEWKASLEVTANLVRFLSGRNEGSEVEGAEPAIEHQQAQKPAQNGKSPVTPNKQAPAKKVVADDDIPF